MKRFLALCFLAVFFGCGGGGSPTQSPTQGPLQSGQVAVSFWATDFTATSDSYYQTAATKVAEGVHCYVYLEQGQTVSQTALDTIVNQFDTNIYPRGTTAFGSEPNPGIDGDPKIYILLLNVRDGFSFRTKPAFVAGYFDPNSEYALNQFAFSNQKELLYMNINPATGAVPGDTEFNSTIAHEFQHIIHWEQKSHQRNLYDDPWLDEGMSSVARDISGYGPDYGLVTTFEHAASHSLTVWEGGAANYGVVYMWAQYFKDQFGRNNIFYSMLHNNQTGIASVNTALTEIGSSKDFTATFRDWAVALYTGDGTTVTKPAGHPEWAYTSIDTWPGVHNGLTLPGLFPATDFQQNATSLAALAAWGFGFYSYTPASGATGSVTWTPASAGEKAYFIDSGSGQIYDLPASGTTKNYTTKGYLIVQNPAETASGTGAAVVRTALTAGDSTARITAPATANGPAKTVREVLSAMNNDPVVRAQVQATGKPAHVCIDSSLRERERALRAQGAKPPF